MRYCLRVGISLYLAVLATLGMGQTLLSFETQADVTPPNIQMTLGTAARQSAGTTHGSFALHAAFLAAPNGFPSFDHVYTTNQNLQNGGILAMDVTNLGAKSERVNFVVTDSAGLKLQQFFDIKPAETRPCGLILNPDPPSKFGLRGLPIYVSGLNLAQPVIPSGFKLDQIRRIGVYLRNPGADTFFAFDNVRLTAAVNWQTIMSPTVDRFGQRTWASIPGKISQISELVTRLTSELTTLNGYGSYADRSVTGSWQTGPTKTNTSGYFRTTKYNGKWYLLAPDGKLFFSSGLNGLSPTSMPTPITGREYMFNWLPSPGDVEYPFITNQNVNGVSTPCFDHAGANIFRKYGDNGANWRNRAVLRQQKWGFNTVGCYVDKMMWTVPNLPFTVELTTNSAAKRFSVKNAKSMIDVYDPNFKAHTESYISQLVQNHNLVTNPNLIGYTTDNELGFRSQTSDIDMAVSVLSYSVEELQTKYWFLKRLMAQYGTIENLNAAWGTTYNNWKRLKPGVTVTSNTPAFIADMKAWVSIVSAKYFSTWKASIVKYDPNHLYLGAKCDYISKEILDGMKGNVNVISINRYAQTLQPDIDLIKTFDMPAYLSEFGASMPRHNNFAIGLSSAMADSHAERATILETVFRQALASTVFVGCHFYRMYDDPVTGTFKDGANSNWGICDITDTPYVDIVNMFRTVNQDIYKR